MRKFTFALALGLAATATAAFAANSLTVISNPNTTSDTTGHTASINFSGGNSGNVYVEDDSPSGETHYKIKFWVNPYTLSLVANKAIRIGGIGDATNGQHILIFLKRNDVDNSWRINTWYKTDTLGYTPGPGVFIVGQGAPNKWVQLQLEYTAATNDGSPDGTLTLQRIAPSSSGVQSVNSLATQNLHVDNIRFGSLAGQGSNATSGSYLFDEFESYR